MIDITDGSSSDTLPQGMDNNYCEVVQTLTLPLLQLPGIRDPTQPSGGGFDLMSPSLAAPMLQYMLRLQSELQLQYRHFCLLTGLL
jgi:hypothetical protein